MRSYFNNTKMYNLTNTATAKIKTAFGQKAVYLNHMMLMPIGTVIGLRTNQHLIPTYLV